MIKIKSKVAVLVLNYNGKHHLYECFSSLKKQIYGNYDVYLVDNGSKDGSVEYVKRVFRWVKIISFEKNFGFAKAYNEAIKRLDVELISLLNNDTKVEENWLSSLVDAIIEDEKIVAVGSKMVLYDRPYLINHAGAKITVLGGNIDIGFYEMDDRRLNARKSVGAVCAGSMLIRKKHFLKVGGFDEDFFSYCEDIDFCWRAWQQGFKIFYEPKSVVHHKLGASWKQKKAFATFLIERNRLYSMIKNFQCKRLLTAYAFSLPYILFKISVFCIRNEIQNAVMVAKANVWILKNLKKVFHKRKLILRKRIINDNKLDKFKVYATWSESLHEFLKLSIKRSQRK